VAKQLVFEDDLDRERFLDDLSKTVKEDGGELLAWCLMDNHFHALIHLEMSKLSKTMRSVLSGYASYFNVRHGRTGHLFQDRFKSEAIDTDEYLLTVVRYIHANPVKAGITKDCRYRWSSYGCYLGEMGPCDTSFVLDVFGGVEQFTRFHSVQADDKCLDVAHMRRRLSDEKALACAKEIAGKIELHEIGSLPKSERDAILRSMRAQGLTIKQVQRLTGIGAGIIDHANRRRG
jgi:REP element-mobilizing transposase RayT